MNISTQNIFASSEIGVLKRVLIHSPDGGIGKIIPSKSQQLLFDDPVHLKTMQKEYNSYVKLLLYFLDPDKAELLESNNNTNGNFFKPDKDEYFNSDKVLDTQKILSEILKEDKVRLDIISAVCASEKCSFAVKNKLIAIENCNELAKVLITGYLPKLNTKTNIENSDFIFPPIPNFIFTRDIGIIIKDHILLSKTALEARKRESILAKYLAVHYLFKDNLNKIIEISENSDFFFLDEKQQEERKITLEGGDIMMIGENHLIVGCSERTSPSAVNSIIHTIYSIPSLEIEKISVIKIPKIRAIMHIDTIFTQVSKDTWVLFGKFSEKLNSKEVKIDYFDQLLDRKDQNDLEEIEVLRYFKSKAENYNPQTNYFQKELLGIEAVMLEVSGDLGVKNEDVKIIYSGNNEFPYDEREQWTDSCNVVALRDGVVIGYDRNEKTNDGFREAGYKVTHVTELLEQLKSKSLMVDDIQKTLILLPSAELSRARGGAHCMSMPLLRENIS